MISEIFSRLQRREGKSEETIIRVIPVGQTVSVPEASLWVS
jgi:hypothetical protein